MQVMLQVIAFRNLSDMWRRNRIYNKNNENSDSSHFYYDILIARIEGLRSEAESRAGKKQIFNVPI